MNLNISMKKMKEKVKTKDRKDYYKERKNNKTKQNKKRVR